VSDPDPEVLAEVKRKVMKFKEIAQMLAKGNRRYPKPLKVGPLSRWLRSECEASVAAMFAERAR
jgi:predicted DNA-binding transcriptional regulator AlpA